VGKGLKSLIAVVVLCGAAAGISYATNAITRTATSTLQACANGTNGNLRLVSSPSDCRTNETAVSWNVVGPQGEQGPPGAAGKDGVDGKDGANGVSPTVTPLLVGDANCPTGGASITDAAGHTAYVCNGAKGDTGASGTPFSGAFQSPSGDFKLSVADSGIKLQGPSSKITFDAGGLSVDSAAALTVRAGTNLALQSGAAASLSGSLVNIGGSGCAAPVRTSDLAGALALVPPGGGSSPVVFPGLVPAADVCIG
jgi:hypothetical protein